MADDPATEMPSNRRAALKRRRTIAAGHQSDPDLARAGLADADPAVVVAGLGALARLGHLRVNEVAAALQAGSVAIRRRAADAALSVRGPGSRSTLIALLIDALADPDPLVVVNATWFLGERRTRDAVAPLAAIARTHEDVRCREAAVAALGAIGDPQGLDAVLAALDDKPTVRRRATVALAGFDDPRVEAALARSSEDRDWQVRQAADELLDG